MRVLLIGSGGREHAIAQKIAESQKLTKFFCFPGNPGIESLAEKAQCDDSIDSIALWAKENAIDLIVSGPETYLVAGLADEAAKFGIPVFGPTKKGAMLEGSKDFSKQFMKKYNVPTAGFNVFTDYDDAVTFIKSLKKYPTVIKADGLAAGKGVKIALNEKEALHTLQDYMIDNTLGKSGNKIVIEEFMTGEEMSVFYLTDGKKFVQLIAAKDYKRAYDNDQGDNTGGMGCYAPHNSLTQKLKEKIESDVMPGIIKGFQNENFDYRGVLYVGLMLTNEGPKVVEFNCRFGDPETQGIMPLIDNDLLEIFYQSATGNLQFNEVQWKNEYAVSVVIASAGYPAQYEKGKKISFQTSMKDYIHAGTAFMHGEIVTNGGRVLNAVATAKTKEEALQKANKLATQVSFEGSFYRKDIGS